MPSVSKQVLEEGFELGALNSGEIDVFEEFIDFLKLQLSFELNGLLTFQDFLFSGQVFARSDNFT